MTAQKRVVLLGAGHAHLYTLKRAAAFAEAGAELVLVAPEPFWYSGLATGVLGGHYPPELDQVDVGALVTRSGGRFVRDCVTAVDPSRKTVQLQDGPPLAYDVLSVTLGSAAPPIPTADGTIGVYTVKPVRQLYELRTELEARFGRREELVRVVVAGGGPTGFEIAANVAALTEARRARAEVTVLAGRRVLAQLPEAAAARVVAALHERGVQVRTPARVTRLEPGQACLDDGGTVPFDLLVNATGLGAAPLVRTFGLPVDEAGALLVDRTLRSVGDPAVYGAGDCIALVDRKLPKIGVYAIREAPVLYRNLLAALGQGEPRRFEPQQRYLWIMNLGNGTGLAARGSFWWQGRLAFRLKDWIDRRFLRAYQQTG